MTCLPYTDKCKHTNGLAAMIVVFAIISNLNYLYFLYLQVPTKISLRLKTLNARLGVVVPIFSVIMFLSFVVPQAVPVLEAAEALAEGFAVYTFFKKVIFTSNGAEHILQTIRDSKHTQPCCHYFQKTTTACFFKSMYGAFFQFLMVRPIFVLIAGIMEANYENTTLYTLFTILAVFSLIYAMMALLRMYQTLGHLSAHLYPERKILFIKVLIVVVLIQNQIFNGRFSSKGDHNFVMERRRLFAIIVSVQLFVASFFLQPIFGKVDPPEPTDGPDGSLVVGDGSNEEPATFLGLWCEVASFWKYTFDGTASMRNGVCSSNNSDNQQQQPQEEVDEDEEKWPSTPHAPAAAGNDDNL